MLVFEKMKKEQSKESSLVATRAFFDYEYFTNYIEDDVKRKKFLEQVMPIELNINKNSINMVAVEDNVVVAIAIIYPPGIKRVPVINYLKAGFLKAYLYGGVLDVNAWVNMDYKAGEPCHKMINESWYLNTLAVDTNKQHQHIGSRFINECIIPFVKKNNGHKLCLFTNAEGNRIFYKKNNFIEFDEREFYYKNKKLGSWSYYMDL